MTRTDIIRAIKRIHPKKKIDRDIMITEVYLSPNGQGRHIGWRPWSGTIDQYVKESEENPSFFRGVGMLCFAGLGDVEVRTCTFSWQCEGADDYGVSVSGWAEMDNGLSITVEGDPVSCMRRKVKSLCKEHGWLFIDAGGDMDEFRSLQAGIWNKR